MINIEFMDGVSIKIDSEIFRAEYPYSKGGLSGFIRIVPRNQSDNKDTKYYFPCVNIRSLKIDNTKACKYESSDIYDFNI